MTAVVRARLCVDHASQWQELYVLELNIAGRIVIEFAWSEFGIEAVYDVTIVIHHQDILDANVLIVQQRLAQVADDLVEVSIAMQALDPKRDPGHDRLFLLDDHSRVGTHGAEVEVILHTESQPEHQGEQQEQPGTKTLYLGGKFHAKTKKNVSCI